MAPPGTTQPMASFRLRRTSWHSDCSNWSLRTRGNPYPSSSTLMMSPGHTSASMISFTDADILQRRHEEMCLFSLQTHSRDALRHHIRGYGGWKCSRCFLRDAAGVEMNPLLLFTNLKAEQCNKALLLDWLFKPKTHNVPLHTNDVQFGGHRTKDLMSPSHCHGDDPILS